MVKTLRNDGVKCELRQGISPGVSYAVTFEDPKGTPIDLYAEYNFAKPEGVPSIFNILKLGHVAYRVLDVHKVVKFYADVLGFRVSDWRGDYFVFMRCNSDHHTVNFITDEKQQLHHVAFEVVDWAKIRKACDYLAHNKVQLAWGPGRHIIGHNVAIYHVNQDQVRVEIFTEMDQMKDEELGYFRPAALAPGISSLSEDARPQDITELLGLRFRAGGPRLINELPQYGLSKVVASPWDTAPRYLLRDRDKSKIEHFRSHADHR